MKAVILAGGLGTRLGPLTYTLPKPMLPLVGKPILQHVINSLSRQGFEEIIIATNYLREKIENCFGDGSKFGVELTYPKEEVPLGTAGSVKNTQKSLNATFAVIQGDNITDISLQEAPKVPQKKGWNSHNISNFSPKPPKNMESQK